MTTLYADAKKSGDIREIYKQTTQEIEKENKENVNFIRASLYVPPIEEEKQLEDLNVLIEQKPRIPSKPAVTAPWYKKLFRVSTLIFPLFKCFSLENTQRAIIF